MEFWFHFHNFEMMSWKFHKGLFSDFGNKKSLIMPKNYRITQNVWFIFKNKFLTFWVRDREFQLDVNVAY